MGLLRNGIRSGYSLQEPMVQQVDFPLIIRSVTIREGGLRREGPGDEHSSVADARFRLLKAKDGFIAHPILWGIHTRPKLTRGDSRGCSSSEPNNMLVSPGSE